MPCGIVQASAVLFMYLMSSFVDHSGALEIWMDKMELQKKNIPHSFVEERLFTCI